MAKITVENTEITVLKVNEEDYISLTDMTLFGKTARQWRDANPDLQGNTRDYAEINQLICVLRVELFFMRQPTPL